MRTNRKSRGRSDRSVPVRLERLENRRLLASTLVSTSTLGTAAAVDAESAFTMSGNGRYLAFATETTGLANIADIADTSDVFVRDLVTGRTELISVNAAGTTSGNAASAILDISDDGRFVLFASDASDLVSGDGNAMSDVFRRDRWTGQTAAVSVAGGATVTRGASTAIMSADGRWVAFVSTTNDLGTTGVLNNVYLRDMNSATTVLVSRTPGGGTPNAASQLRLSSATRPNLRGVSEDGRYVLFASNATDLVATGDANGGADLFVFDRDTNGIELVTVNEAGTAASNAAVLFNGYVAGLSTDGRKVVFASSATDLTTLVDATNDDDIFLRDLDLDTTTAVSVNLDGTLSGAAASLDDLSDDARYVVFSSTSTGFVATTDANGVSDVFRRDVQAASTVLVSVATTGNAADGASSGALVSNDGAIVSFVSTATNLISPALSGPALGQAYVRDMGVGANRLVSFNRATGTNANSSVGSLQMLGGGNRLAFASTATSLSSSDPGAKSDVFVSSELRVAGLGSNQRFVAQVYWDLLGRAAEPNGLSFWAGQINSSAMTREQVALNIGQSSEARNLQALDAFLRLLRRFPSTPDLTFWSNTLLNQGEDAMLAGILGSGEYFANAGGTNLGFVKRLFLDALERPSQPGGEAFYVAQLDGGSTPQQVALAVLQTTEADTLFVRKTFARALNRAPGAGGLNGFVTQLQGGARQNAVAASILGTSEYINPL